MSRKCDMHGRSKPYTNRGVERLPCVRCGKSAFHQWQICSDNRLFRPICMTCDVALNELVLRWIGFRDWRKKMAAYKRKVYVNRDTQPGRYPDYLHY